MIEVRNNRYLVAKYNSQYTIDQMVFLNLFFSLIVSVSFGNTCSKWFKDTKIKSKTKDCEQKCLLAEVDFSTFLCRLECVNHCAGYIKEQNISIYAYYPGLTPKELALIEKHNKEAVIVFIQKEVAEFKAHNIFNQNRMNGEEDAIRHYLWAGLLVNHLGPELAKNFLDAHEANPSQPEDEKSMDLANNRAGILAGQKLMNEKSFNLDKLVEMGLSELNNGSLSVLKPQIPKESPL